LNTTSGLFEIRTWAVTVFFTLCGLLAFLVTPVDSSIILFAAASGLVVDLFSLLAVNVLPKKVPYRIKLKKVLTQNLA
jgi:hypothetical protein